MPTENKQSTNNGLILFVCMNDNNYWELFGANNERNVCVEFASEQELNTWLEENISSLNIKAVYDYTDV